MPRITPVRLAAILVVAVIGLALIWTSIAQRDPTPTLLGALLGLSFGMGLLNRRLLWATRREMRRANRATARQLAVNGARLKGARAAEKRIERAAGQLGSIERRILQFDRARDSRTAAQFDWLARRHRQQERELADFLQAQLSMIAETDHTTATGGERFSHIEDSLDQVRRQVGALAEMLREQQRALSELGAHQNAFGSRKHLLGDISALLTMYGDAEWHAPALGDWSMAPRSLERLRREILEMKPTTIVELGSGASTPFMGLWARSVRPDARLFSIEHDRDHLVRTREMLSFLGVQGVTVEHAPLVPLHLNDCSYLWYQGIPDVGAIDLLVVDGPPGATGDLSRFPAVPELAHALQHGARVLLDDVDRDDERACIERWTAHQWHGRRLQHIQTVDSLAVLEVVVVEDASSRHGEERD